jgi:flagellar hook-basal body complex protein FliE
MSQISTLLQPVLQPVLQRFGPAQDPTLTPSSQDEALARRAADSVAHKNEQSRQDSARRAAPDLATPVASAAGFAGLGALLPLIAGQHPAMVPGATAEAFAVLHRRAAVAVAGADTTPPALLVEQARTLINLATADGQLVLPTPAEVRALAGTGDGVPPGMEALHALLSDAPAARDVLEELAQLPDEELKLGRGGNPRTDFVLLLVALLMKMAASQREQAVAMVELAVQSLGAMTDSMVASAKATQSAKIVTAVVGGLVAAGGVGLGAGAAYKGVQNLRSNKLTADVTTGDASHANSATAQGMNNAPAGATARPPQVETMRQRPQTSQETAALRETEIAVSNTKTGVVANAGQAVTQTSVGVGTVAGTPLDLEATGHTVDSERDRISKDIEVELGSKINQDANKSSESQQATFNTLVTLEQDKHDAVKHIVGNMRR